MQEGCALGDCRPRAKTTTSWERFCCARRDRSVRRAPCLKLHVPENRGGELAGNVNPLLTQCLSFCFDEGINCPVGIALQFEDIAASGFFEGNYYSRNTKVRSNRDFALCTKGDSRRKRKKEKGRKK